MTERFEKAYNSLVRAFFEGTLAKGTCLACACGNIILDAIGAPITKEEFDQELKFIRDTTGELSIPSKSSYATDLWASKRIYDRNHSGYVSKPFFVDVVNEAGYNTCEFAQIENAFENNSRIPIRNYPYYNEQEILEDQYEGLCAVVDVLIKLDQDDVNPDELKAKFREHPALMTSDAR